MTLTFDLDPNGVKTNQQVKISVDNHSSSEVIVPTHRQTYTTVVHSMKDF